MLLAGINDTDAHARRLVRLLEGMPAKINLIPFNPFPNTRYRCSPPATMERFFALLNRAGIVTITRKTRGDDIDAACGQLAGVITSYSIHYTKLYESGRSCMRATCSTRPRS